MKKKAIVSVISVICVIAVAVGIFAGCSSKKSNSNTSNSAQKGAITVISREEGSGTRDAFTELMGITDDSGNDATAQSAEITNSTSVMMSTVQGNKNAIGYVSLGSLSDSVKALKLDGAEASVETIKNGSYKLQRPFNIAYIDGSLSKEAHETLAIAMNTIGGKSNTGSKMSGTVTLAGSTSVAPVMNVLADEYKKLNPGMKIEIQESGSSAGIESAMQGAVNIAMSSRELKNNEAAKLKSQKIALDGIAVIVNKENKLDNITSAQVKDIFLGNTTTWDAIK